MTEREAIRQLIREQPAFVAKLMKIAVNEKLKGFTEVESDAEFVVLAGEWPAHIVGSKQERCEICGEFVGIAPSTQEVMKTRIGPVRIQCFPCALKISGQAAAQ